MTGTTGPASPSGSPTAAAAVGAAVKSPPPRPSTVSPYPQPPSPAAPPLPPCFALSGGSLIIDATLCGSGASGAVKNLIFKGTQFMKLVCTELTYWQLFLNLAMVHECIDIFLCARVYSSSGFNVFIQSGSGPTSTYGSPNGLGNLFLGYNVGSKNQTGSHNLVS